MLDFTGEVRLCGLHQMTNLIADGTKKMSVFGYFGELDWMAPEVISQNVQHTQKSDIYSFGITCIELAYGKTPFHTMPALKILLSKLQFECPAPESEKVLPFAFKHMVNACVDRNANKRPTAAELLEHDFWKEACDPSFIAEEVVFATDLCKKHQDSSSK